MTFLLPFLTADSSGPVSAFYKVQSSDFCTTKRGYVLTKRGYVPAECGYVLQECGYVLQECGYVQL
jgi:hypothetical protein